MIPLSTPLPAAPALTRPLGRHLATANGMKQTIEVARQIGCTAAQIFPGNPKGWRHVPLAPERAREARAAWAGAGIHPLTIHAPYIINIASPDDALYATSMRALSNALDRAGELGAPFVIVHLGSHKGSGVVAGTERLLTAATRAIDERPAWQYLLLENNVGAGNAMGATLEALGSLVRAAAHPRIGVCIDTAHLWGAGFDLRTTDGAIGAVEAIDRFVGLHYVHLLHLNDSPVPLGSHRDQHTHLGQGQIGYHGLAALLTHPGLTGLPVILETPDGGVEQETIRLRTAALLCVGDADGARTLQEATLPTGTSTSGAAREVAVEDASGNEAGD